MKISWYQFRIRNANVAILALHCNGSLTIEGRFKMIIKSLLWIGDFSLYGVIVQLMGGGICS